MEFARFLEVVRIGYELETRTVDGRTLADIERIQHEGTECHTDASLYPNWRNEIITAVRMRAPRAQVLLTNIGRYLDSSAASPNLASLTAGIVSLVDASRLGPEGKEAVKRAIAQKLEINTRFIGTPIGTGRMRINDSMHRLYSTAMAGHTAVPDGSVSGPEIKTDRPLSFVEAVEHAGRLATLPDIVVDSGCSFHIHLSYPGMDLTYSQELQAKLLISTATSTVPDSVRSRWRSDSRDRYFKPILTQDKYAFVSHRPAHGTWEFRAFGNVSSDVEMKACILAAITALHASVYGTTMNEISTLMPYLNWESDRGHFRTSMNSAIAGNGFDFMPLRQAAVRGIQQKIERSESVIQDWTDNIAFEREAQITRTAELASLNAAIASHNTGETVPF